MISEKTARVEKFLQEHGIEFVTHHHPPLPTIELALEYWKEIDSTHCKNLFFRNHKGNRHYLVVFECHKELGVHSLEKSLRQGKLSFASQERMERCLGLLPGSVSPFGLINDMNLVDEHGSIQEGVSAKELFENGHRVKLFLDKDLQTAEKVSFHPCDNTASTVISNADLLKFLEIWGGEYEWIDICEEKTLSIIIPAYNAGKYLGKCLESCCRQDIPSGKYEIIIVNDGSTDDTGTIAEKWASEHVNIRVITQENKGLSMARNAGIEAATGKYIIFIDSDDHIAENSLSALVDRCCKDNLDMLRFCAANVSDETTDRRFSYTDGQIHAGKELLKERFQVCAPFAIYRKTFLDSNSLRFFPGIYHEDNLFTPQAYYLAEKAASTDDVIYMVRQTPGSITRTPKVKRGYDLIGIAGMLTGWAEENVEPQYRPFIYKQAADCLNGCFKLIGELPDTEADELSDALNKNGKIVGTFLRSSALTHRIEGFLIKMFPKRMKGVYDILNWLRR